MDEDESREKRGDLSRVQTLKRLKGQQQPFSVTTRAWHQLVLHMFCQLVDIAYTEGSAIIKASDPFDLNVQL